MNHVLNGVRAIGLSLFALAGCHTVTDTSHYGTTGGPGAGGNGGTTSTSGPTSGPSSSTTSSSGGPSSIPFAVDDVYAPSGFMGDGESPGALVDAPTCTMRAGEKKGLCHHVTWKPGMKGWAGIYWQYPDGNWGTKPGHSIAAGATAISFWAWGSKGGEKVDFFAGINPPDGFKVETGDITLTTTPTQYFVKLGSAKYDVVVGAFGWSSGTSDGKTPVQFYVDDIQWQTVAGGPGCTAKTAANYDPNATTDDGSCQFAVTFQVDMSSVMLTPADVVNLQATFNKWCGDCNPLTDPNKTGTWSVTLPLAPGAYEYKYTTNGWNGQVESVPLACDVTNGAQHNRGFTVVKDPLTLAVKWGLCP
jgi:hypothetical protein